MNPNTFRSMTFRNSTFQNQKFGASSGLNEKYLLAAKRSTAVFDPSKLPLADGASVGSFPEIFGRYTATQETSAFKPILWKYSQSIVESFKGKWALSFINDDYCAIPASSSLNIEDEITIRFKMQASAMPANLDSPLRTSGDQYGFLFNGVGSLAFSVAYNAAATPSGWVQTGRIYDIVGSAKVGEKVKIYVDGVLLGESAANLVSIPAFSSGLLYLGWEGSSTRFFDGIIKDVEIFEKRFTAEEVANVTNGGVIHTEYLKGKWNLDEGTGTTITDSSGNGNNGTITGATWARQSILPVSVMSDGSDDFMESPALFSAGGGGVGFIGVVKFTRVAEEVIFHQGESVTNKGVGLSTLGTGAVRFFFYGNDLTSSTGKISAGGTYILTANFYGGTRIIRLNGVQIASDTPVGKNTTSNTMRFYGRKDNARYLSGDSGQFILKDGGFSASEIAFYEKYLSAQYAIPLS